MLIVPVFLLVSVLLCLTSNKAVGVELFKKFTVSGNGIHGIGSYTVINGQTKISLELDLGGPSDKPDESGNAVITSLPGNSGPNTSQPPGTGISTSTPSGPKPSMSQAQGTGLMSSLPAESKAMVEPSSLTMEDNLFIDAMVAAHNEFRSVHFSPPIQKNFTLSQAAKGFAQILAGKQDLFHSPLVDRPGQGESLAMGCTTGAGEAITAAEAVKKWYEEACFHNFSIHAFQKGSGHFSQLVWKATEVIGVGRAFGEKWGMNCTFIVARYFPKGNVDTIMAFMENVENGTFDPIAYNCSALKSGASGANGNADAVQAHIQQDNKMTKKPLVYPGNRAEYKLPYKNTDHLGNREEHKLPYEDIDFPGNREEYKFPYQTANIHKYRELYYKKPNVLNSYREPLSYVKVPQGFQSSSPLVSRYQGYALSNRGYRLPHFISNYENEYQTRLRSATPRAKIPHSSVIMKRDDRVFWFIS